MEHLLGGIQSRKHVLSKTSRQGSVYLLFGFSDHFPFHKRPTGVFFYFFFYFTSLSKTYIIIIIILLLSLLLCIQGQSRSQFSFIISTYYYMHFVM